ncbi:glycosyltransferase family 4 protein [Sulfurospirillum sp. 1612]|uniref:glycosyltransferase family 4 protein n=1 Tax=Sulfurospirillum sp. 1612 TaxID=3094835 RepID=UPI002F93595A
MRNFKVDILVFGRFHLFDLAKQLNKSGVMNKLFTTYPKYKVKEWGLTKEKIVSKVIYEIIMRLTYKTGIKNYWFNSFLKTLFSNKVSKELKKNDVFIGSSGSSLETLIKAKEEGIVTIIERGCSHYNYQQNILTEEFSLQGLKYNPDYPCWQRELLEYELADYISIPSSFVKRSFLEHGIPEEKLLVNPYGVDLSKFKQIPKTDKIFRIIYAGGLTFQKGSHYLLQAFNELSLENCELWHLGSINEEMRPYIEKYKNENIKFLGHKPQNELYKYYSQGSVFIMPSIQEGMAMVQLQAMACGLPLVCTTNTGGDDLITKDGEEGFVIPIRNVEAIKEKILFLYENQDIAKEMGKKAKARVSSGFTWDDYGDRYIKNLERILVAKNK